MRNLISGIVGVVFGGFILCAGGFSSTQGSGAYRAGTFAGFICGGIFFLAGIPYLILGIMELANSGGSRSVPTGRRRRKPKEPAASPDETKAKASATTELLGLLAKDDEWFDPARLKGIVEKLFVMFQEGWEQNDFQPLGKYVVHDCLDKYLNKYDDDMKRLKLAKLDDCRLKRVQLVHVNAAGEAETHTFTALVDIDGPDKLKECWTFARTAKRWKLDRMTSAATSNIVERLNDVPAEFAEALQAEEGNDDILAYIARG
jgi:predicted lipid-binding transport protein (Tim44 family)